jgi:hypothetical protein
MKIMLNNWKNENSVTLSDLTIQNERLKSLVDSTLTENEKLRHISRENIKTFVLMHSLIVFSELLTIKRDLPQGARFN